MKEKYINAFIIGLFAGIGIYGVVINNRGLDFLLFNILIPLLIVLQLMKLGYNSIKEDKE